MKNALPNPYRFYVMSLYFDNNESENELLRQMKNKYTCDIPDSYLYIDPTD